MQSVLTGAWSVPTGAQAVPTGVQAVPTGVQSVPTGAWSVPTGAWSVLTVMRCSSQQCLVAVLPGDGSPGDKFVLMQEAPWQLWGWGHGRGPWSVEPADALGMSQPDLKPHPWMWFQRWLVGNSLRSLTEIRSATSSTGLRKLQDSGNLTL